MFVCLSVSEITQKKACMDLDEMLRVDRCRDMDDWLTFESDPDHSPDAGTGLLSPISYRPRNFAVALAYAASELRACYAEFYVGKTPHMRICGTSARR